MDLLSHLATRINGIITYRGCCQVGVRRKDPRVHLLASLAAGDDGDGAAGCQVAIDSVQDLLDHKHITTTQIYDKRQRSVRDSGAHKASVWEFINGRDLPRFSCYLSLN